VVSVRLFDARISEYGKTISRDIFEAYIGFESERSETPSTRTGSR
jgi:hypothetical protein